MKAVVILNKGLSCTGVIQSDTFDSFFFFFAPVANLLYSLFTCK